MPGRSSRRLRDDPRRTVHGRLRARYSTAPSQPVAGDVADAGQEGPSPCGSGNCIGTDKYEGPALEAGDGGGARHGPLTLHPNSPTWRPRAIAHGATYLITEARPNRCRLAWKRGLYLPVDVASGAFVGGSRCMSIQVGIDGRGTFTDSGSRRPERRRGSTRLFRPRQTRFDEVLEGFVELAARRAGERRNDRRGD